MADWPYNTQQWQRLRLAKLAHDPLCFACQLRGQVTLARAVDHVRSIKSGGDAFPPLDGLMSLCDRCHNEKTGAVDRPDRASSGRRFKGCDANGNPIDPADEWHGGGASKDQNGSPCGPMWELDKYLVSNDLDDEAGFA